MKLTKVFFDEIRELIVSARTTVARGVDLVQVYTNYEIGRRIVLQEQKGKNRAAYGEELLAVLAARLSEEFGKGFSRSNIAYMRSFYLAYQDRGQIIQTASGLLPSLTTPVGGTPFQIVQTLSGQFPKPFSLSWSHYVFLLGIKNSDERHFYEIEANSQNWALRELKRQFNSGLYERLALSRDKAGIRKLAKEGQIVSQPKDANIHAREYQLYLPGKEELQKKLEEWAVEAGA